jgi:anaerobic magnesium-protoporphyrin IX monomethyl ester cyclase
MMNVLVMWPPHIPSYFNAGHHLGVFLTAAYLRDQPGIERVDAVDAGALNYTWKELGELFHQGRYDLVAIVNDFDNIDDLPRLLRYIRTLSPGTRTITGGRLSIQAPEVLRTFEVDAVVHGGDLEPGVAGYAAWLAQSSAADPAPAGVSIRTGHGWSRGPRGVALPAAEWRLPDPADIPYEAYDRMYHRDQNKFCGIPERRELVVPAARGCPVNCSFCDVPSVQGLRDRRLTVERTVSYIEECFARHPFEYVSFYAPTFTFDRKWTLELCERLVARGARLPWKCATTIAHLDDDLLAAMAAAGCIRVSVGVETLEAGGLPALPLRKQTELNRFRDLAASCARHGVELNCFVIAGLPGTTVDGTARTVEEIRKVGARVRPTVYSSLDRLRQAPDVAALSAFNRQLMHPDDVADPETADAFHAFLFGPESWSTRVMERIPARGARP